AVTKTGQRMLTPRWAAPAWNDVTQDGDLAYLPEEMPSVVGEQLLSKGFPYNRAKSQIAFYAIRDNDVLNADDLVVAYDLARRLKNLHAVAAFTRGKRLAEEAGRLAEEGQTEESEQKRSLADADLAKAASSLNEAVRLDQKLAEYNENRSQEAPADGASTYVSVPRLPEIYYNRYLLNAYNGKPADATADLDQALALDPDWANRGDTPMPEEAADLPLLDVWTWLDDVFGKKLGTKHARLIVLQLSNEFMATDNIRVLTYLEDVLATVRDRLPQDQRKELALGYSGSAAVGGDLLRAAKDSIKNTELFTVVLVVLILGFVYRSPLLIAMPLITITISLMAATAIVAMLTQVDRLPGFDWWTFKVFTTTRIFIVVILFGAGTDYFLFLVARYKEELLHGFPPAQAIEQALAGVGDALAASALTTILGLGTMFFADFGKFSNSGPAIGMCLAVTLLACITLAPAFLRACGRAVFWPFGLPQPGNAVNEGNGRLHLEAASPGHWFWERVACGIVRRPGLILVTCVLILLPLAYRGVRRGDHITYDFLRQLPADRPSRQGAEMMAEHFPVGESGPILVVAYDSDGHFDTNEGREQIRDLTGKLYLDGVESVRSISDPLGDFPPNAQMGLFRMKSWLKLVSSPHPRTQEIFVATSGELAGKVARFDLLLSHDPFSAEASDALERVESYLRGVSESKDSPWHDATFAFSGTTAGIRDLKLVTRSDNSRIQILVVLAVLAVLLAILKRPLICCYMILTVLLSYFVTIGATEWFFSWLNASEFRGLDWKVPLFLFVILVAIGQDYNVYLATRVFEEQQRLGPLAGLKHAVVRTGGIITSCGVIMAGTFSAMTSGTWGRFVPAWIPGAKQLFGSTGSALPAIVQLGFALTLGVILDTFVVRPILVPAFLALLCRWQGSRPEHESRHISDERQQNGPHQRCQRGSKTGASV
ncbi:MAG: MMPL family transporter, partial [Planctomycetes bacterium]|nr:MMPL family transporter [Planctomycetota bacterium]